MMMSYSKKIYAATLLSLLMGSSALAADLNSTLYIESKKALKLYKGVVLKNGDRALAPQVEVPEESILAIDLGHITAALTARQDSPERINFPFVESMEETRPQRHGNGWMCGLRVVDVTDSELREDSAIDGNDFCLSLDNLKNIRSLDTNGELIQFAYSRFEKQNDLSALNALASEMETQERLREQYGELYPIAAKQIISPIKNCSKGCLVARSEYGMRKHPVYKTNRLHKGIDLRASVGTPIVSVYPGKILANRTELNKKKKIVGYGHYVIVVHPENKMETLYAHLSKFKGKAGDNVSQGTVIALSGQSGVGTGPHLHFETHPLVKGQYKLENPRKYIGHLLGKLASVLKLFTFHV